MKLLSILILGLMMPIMLTASQARACSCIPLDQSRGYIELLHEEVAAASAVIRGQVVSLKEEQYHTIATIAVDKALTGGLTGTVDVRSATQSNACGYPFVKEGARHLLYLYENDDGVYEVNVCGRSRPLDEARRAVNPLLDIELLTQLKRFAAQ